MAVNNSLSKSNTKDKSQQLVTFDVNGFQVQLTPQIVRDYLVSGDKERVDMKEIVMFINLCKFSGLNPWLKEAYCIKYGNEPATMVVAKEALQKRAEKNPAYDGHVSGIIVIDGNGEIQYRVGGFRLPDEEIVGGYAEVWRKDRNHSYRVEVSFDEYAGRKKDGTLNNQWAKKPATMIKKVALAQALREAFPTDMNGLYSAEEQGLDETVLDVTPVEQPQVLDMPDVQEEKTEHSNNDVQAALFGK